MKAAKKISSSLAAAQRVLRIEARAIESLRARLDVRFERAVELLLACGGRVVVTGIGKSGLVGRKIAATLTSTGTPAVFLHAAEALHGDMGMVVRNDVLLAISASGGTEELVAILERVKRLGVPIVALTGNLHSMVAKASDVALDVSVKEEACTLNLAPTASTAASLAMGDALAMALAARRGFGEEDFAALHPKGRLGSKLRRLESLMHTGEALPRVPPSTPIPAVIYEISRKRLGLAAVADKSNRLLGIITDGDLRRLMERRKKEALDLTAAQCMTTNPVTLLRHDLAATALRLMEERKITSVLVVDKKRRLEGVVHLHDLLALQLF